MAITVYTNMSNDEAGEFVWRERMIRLKDVYLLRVCGTKLKITYKEKPAEELLCTSAELNDILANIPAQ